MPKIKSCIIVLAIALCLISQAVGQTQPRSINAVKIIDPPQVDGKLDDPCWQEAPKATNFIDQFFNTPVEDQTTACILYDDADYSFLSPYINFRFADKFSLGLSSQFLWHKKDRIQHVIIANYDITPEKGLGSRLVYLDGNCNAFVTYRQAVRKGIDAFIIIGDPNAGEMKRRALLKVIVPL